MAWAARLLLPGFIHRPNSAGGDNLLLGDSMKNDFEIRGDVTAIFLRNKNGEIIETLIDTADLTIADSVRNRWYAHKTSSGDYYVMLIDQKAQGKKTVILHRLLMGNPEGYLVDHINHNTLDNRRSNLRVVTNTENQQNRKGANSDNKVSKVLGVSWHKSRKKWQARVQVNKKEVYLGVFDCIQEAEKAVLDARARLLPFSKEAQLAGGKS